MGAARERAAAAVRRGPLSARTGDASSSTNYHTTTHNEARSVAQTHLCAYCDVFNAADLTVLQVFQSIFKATEGARRPLTWKEFVKVRTFEAVRTTWEFTVDAGDVLLGVSIWACGEGRCGEGVHTSRTPLAVQAGETRGTASTHLSPWYS